MSSTSQVSKEPLSLGTMLKSDSGQAYKIEEVLADRRKPLLCVYRASSEGKNYIVKNMIQGEFEYQLNLQKSLSSSPNVRAVVDTVRELEVFIYPFLSLLMFIEMIYVMVNEMVFRVSDDEMNSVDSWRYILGRHISYFADEDGLNGLLEHIGEENPFYERLINLANSFGHGNPRQPFQHWSYVEPELRDLVGKMTNLDPTKRISATEALQHRWFNET
ncbi:hypothetical protein ZTR_10085 [Talaromyces verruculosus]|nr:hypothetical protein ZTR_10085 [Talaromyces verruculosus]